MLKSTDQNSHTVIVVEPATVLIEIYLSQCKCIMTENILSIGNVIVCNSLKNQYNQDNLTLHTHSGEGWDFYITPHYL